ARLHHLRPDSARPRWGLSSRDLRSRRVTRLLSRILFMRAIIIALDAGRAPSAAAQLRLPPLPNIFGAPRVAARLYVGASATDRGSVLRSVSNAVDDARGIRTFGVDLILNTGFDPRARWAPEIALGFSRLDRLLRGTLVRGYD